MVDRTLPNRVGPVARPVLVVEEPRSRLSSVVPWAAACLFTLAAHGGLFWYLTHERKTDAMPPLEEPAAVMIDMAPEVQQAFSQTDQAVGQPMQEAMQEPPPPDELKADPTPPVEDSPTEAIAPLPPKPPEKPKVKKPPHKLKKPVEKLTPKAAARTAGGPRSDQHAERTTAASAGAANAAVVADWKSQVSAAINRNKRYPGGGDTGSPVIHMSVAGSGAVSGVNVVSSSGSGALDAAAVEAVRRSSPLPPPPGGATGITFRMNFHR